MKIDELIDVSPIIPVVEIDNYENAIPLAKTLIDAGINIIEITLRTEAAIESIKAISKEFPEFYVGAGTVCNENDLIKAKNAGAKFVFSPGISDELIKASIKNEILLIPGVSNASEVMKAQNSGIFFCKLFPAILSGGVEILKAFQGPFPKIKFCPTGGININNFLDFLDLKNVPCVGGSWIVKKELINNSDFKNIEKLCIDALKLIK